MLHVKASDPIRLIQKEKSFRGGLCWSLIQNGASEHLFQSCFPVWGEISFIMHVCPTSASRICTFIAGRHFFWQAENTAGAKHNWCMDINISIDTKVTDTREKENEMSVSGWLQEEYLRRAAFVYNTGGSTASSGITGKLDNSAHVKVVYSEERLGACVIKPCHRSLYLAWVNSNSEFGLESDWFWSDWRHFAQANITNVSLVFPWNSFLNCAAVRIETHSLAACPLFNFQGLPAGVIVFRLFSTRAVSQVSV